MVCDEIAELDGPWIHEYDLDIEEDEEHGHEIELHREARRAFANGEHAAFVGRIFGGVIAARAAEHNAECEYGDRKTECNDDLEKDGQVLFRHGDGVGRRD